MKASLLVLFSIFMFLSIPQKVFPRFVSDKSESSESEVDEAYKVYSVFLSNRNPAVIVNPTSSNRLESTSEGNHKVLIDKLSPLSEETLKDYNHENGSTHKLENRFSGKAKVIFVTNEEISNLFKEKGVQAGWEAFYEKYPQSHGFVRFSGVGFNSSKNQALVYVASSCGGRCGQGVYYLLEKVSNEWKIKKDHMVWIS